MSDPHLSVVEPADFQCSIIRGARDTITHAIGFRDALSGIKTGRWAKQVGVVREAYGSGGREAAAAPKKLLPGILFSGTFRRRAADAIDIPSGLICADLDHLDDRLASLKEHLITDDHVLAVFVSPTGSGLKCIFRCDPAKDHKTETFPALEKYVADHFGELIDEKCDDISRICFVSHDPDLWANDDAEVIPYPPPEPRKAPKEFILPPRADGTDLKPGHDFNIRGASSVPELLTSHGWTHLRGIYWCRPGKKGGVSATWGFYENTLIVHSSATETGFPSDQKGFDPFAIYAHLEHGGDWRAATRALGEKGYGAPLRKSRQEQRLDHVAGPAEESGTPIGQGADQEGHIADEAKAIADADAKEMESLQSRRVTLAKAPVEPVTRLFLAGKPIATPGNLMTIISRAKTGKTAALGGAVAAIIAAASNKTDLDTLSFTASNPESKSVVVIDTEQSIYDAWVCYQRALKRADTEADPAWLYHYSLVGYSVAKLRVALALSAKAAKGDKGVFCIILDGVADFVLSVNDEAETSGFIADLRSLAVEYDCPIICVIHSNEAIKAGDDGRGHLGKQLTRKAESNLLLRKNGEVTVITSEKQRKAPITEEDGVAFKWSDAEQRHVSCASEKDQKLEAKRDKAFQMAEAMFEHLGKSSARYAELLKAIGEVRKVGPSASEDRFSDMKKMGVISKDIVGNWTITP